ncbi:glycine N-acyltransferase-like protein 3 [Mytilus galloprovincialis]|uniref:glycine N-acyltransferase-like protein 3 n=1 Tax=Mytilus galloprovincialis TaxID=29158 RepID=UPI003F7C8222
MIYQILNENEVVELEKELRKTLPGTAKIYYVIRSFVNGNLQGYEVLVDNWPSWSCIILRPHSEKQVPRYFSHTYMCHSKSVTALKYFIQRPGVINWEEPVTFTGLPNDIIPVITELSRKHGATVTSKESRFMYCWTKPEPPPLPQIPDDICLGTLEQKHVETMKTDWESTSYREDLEGYFSGVVQNFDSSCVTDKKGNLLAYICMQYNGAMAMLYIRPEFRQCGYFNILLSDLTRKRLAKTEVAYAFIPVQDTQLIKLAREFGFEWVPEGNMTWIRYNPPAQPNRLSNVTKTVEAKSSNLEDCLNHFKINAIPLTTL